MITMFFSFFPASAQESRTTNEIFQDDPEARALYDKMVETMREADSLSWVSEYWWEARGREIGHCTYKIWLKKPNYARMEATRKGTKKIKGILVGDGENFWTYWPGGKPRYGWETAGKYGEEYQKHRMTSYMKEPAPEGRHSIGHKAGDLGAGMSMTIIDPSTFHGYTDSLQPYLDGVRSMGMEKVGREKCDLIEVSFMKHQRSWYLWLSRKDHLPRKLKAIIRVSYDITKHELWSEIKINRKISNDLFVWKPPKDWKEWRQPPIEEGLLKPGTPAPYFVLKSLSGDDLGLSEFRGKPIWLYVWRCG